MDRQPDMTAEERAEQAEAELARLKGEYQHFIYAVSHDLQEPLRTVASYLQLLQRRHAPSLGPEANELIGFAVDGATRMGGMIAGLLAFSRATSQRLAVAPTDLHPVTAGAIQSLRHRIESAGAEVVVDGRMPLVMGDAAQLSSLFLNLIGNAVKYRAPGRRPQVRISAEHGQGEWVVSVADNGIGIEPAARERIFLAFQRPHGVGSYEGTGMGLAICKTIVERHHGRLWVESDPGQGSVFRVALPAPR